MIQTRRKLLWFLMFASLTKFSYQASPQPATKLIASKSEVKFDECLMNVTIQMQPSGKNDFRLDLHAHLFVEIENFHVRVGIALPSLDGSFDSFIAQSVSDVCKYFEDSNANMFLRLFFNGRFANKSLPTSCPIKPGHYYFEGFRFNESILKLRAVETKFMVAVDLCTMDQNQQLKCAAYMKFYGEIRDRKKWEKEIAEGNVTKSF